MRPYYNIDINELKVGETISPLYQEILILEIDAEKNIVVFVLVNVLAGNRQPQYDTRYRLSREEFMLMLPRMGPVYKHSDLFGAGAFQASTLQTVLHLPTYSAAAAGPYVTSENPPF